MTRGDVSDPAAVTRKNVLAPFRAARTLAIDDNASNVALVRATLTLAGLREVHTITDTSSVMERIRELRPELILLDLHMPHVDGYAILTELQDPAFIDIAVLVLTADTTRDAAHRALALGARDFLTKPIDAVELTLRVRNLLHASALQTELLRRAESAAAARDVAQALISATAVKPTQLVADKAREVADADLVVFVSEPSSDGADPAPPAVSAADDDVIHERVAVAQAREMLWTLTGSDGPTVFTELGGPRLNAVATPDAPLEGRALAVPIHGTRRFVGTLCLARDPDRPPFLGVEIEFIADFGHHAAIALELAEAQAAQQLLSVIEERNRISTSLHDEVIQRLFAIGVHMDSLRSALDLGDIANKITTRIAELDETISTIRETIFTPADRATGAAQVTSIGDDAAPTSPHQAR